MGQKVWKGRGSHPNIPKPMTMAEAGRLGWVVKIRCNGCFKSAYYLASDLAAVFGDDRFVDRPPPIVCSRCKTASMLHAEAGSPDAGAWGNLVIRRPGPVRQIQTWRTVKLGDEV